MQQSYVFNYFYLIVIRPHFFKNQEIMGLLHSVQYGITYSCAFNILVNMFTHLWRRLLWVEIVPQTVQVLLGQQSFSKNSVHSD